MTGGAGERGGLAGSLDRQSGTHGGKSRFNFCDGNRKKIVPRREALLRLSDSQNQKKQPKLLFLIPA